MDQEALEWEEEEKEWLLLARSLLFCEAQVIGTPVLLLKTHINF